MAFWKKSDDPWDLEPDKRRPAAGEEAAEKEADDGSLLQDLRAWNKARKEEKARRATPPAPIPCPWCGKEMEVGYLIGGRDAVRLVRQRPGLLQIAEDALYIRGDGTFWCDYKIAWTCPDCRKLVADLPEPEETWDNDTLRGEAQENQHEGEN